MKALNFEEIKIAKQALTSTSKRISIILDHFRSEDNIAHIFRLADAFRVEHIYILTDDDTFKWNVIERKSRSCSNHIKYSIHQNIDEILSITDQQLVALEWTDTSIAIDTIPVDDHPIIIVLGNERAGIDKDILKHCTQSVHIPMYGNNSSMNVAMAAGIAIYALRR